MLELPVPKFIQDLAHKIARKPVKTAEPQKLDEAAISAEVARLLALAKEKESKEPAGPSEITKPGLPRPVGLTPASELPKPVALTQAPQLTLPTQPAPSKKLPWYQRIFVRGMTAEEEYVQQLEWLVESGAAVEYSGKLLELYLHSRHITRRKFMFNKILNRFYKHIGAYYELERKAAEEIASGAEPYYQLLLLKPEDKVAILQYMQTIAKKVDHDDPKLMFKPRSRFSQFLARTDADDVKRSFKWWNRFRNLFKNFSRVATSFQFINWLKNLSLPFAVLSIVFNFATFCLDLTAALIDLKRTFRTRYENEGLWKAISAPFLENNRIWNMIDSLSACMSSITTVVLELAFGLLTPSIIVGMAFTAFDAAFTIWGAIYADKALKAKIDYLETTLKAIDAEILEEEKALKEREVLSFQRIRDLQEHLLQLQAAAEKCTSPEERLSLFRGQNKIIDTINELEEKKSQCFSEKHRELLRHRKNFTAAIHKEKLARLRATRDTMVNMALFALIMGSVITLQFCFPAGAAMLFVCALAKTAWKVYQRAREVGGLKALLTGTKPARSELLIQEEGEAIKDNGAGLLLSEEMRMQANIREAMEARTRAQEIPGWRDEDTLARAGLQSGCKSPNKVAVNQPPSGGTGGAATPVKLPQPISHAYLKLAVQVAGADEKRPDAMAWLYDGMEGMETASVQHTDAKDPKVDLSHPAAATKGSAVPSNKLLCGMTNEKRRVLIEELARSAMPVHDAMATPAA